MTGASRWVLVAAALGCVLRLAFGVLYWTDQPLTRDEREYLALARSIARGDGFRYPSDEPLPGTGQRAGRAPGYPVFLASLGVVSPAEHVPARVKVAQAIVGALGILLIAAIARRAAGDRAGIAAAVLAAIYPPLVFLPAYALSETLFSTAALAAAWLLAISDEDPRRRAPIALAAAATGAAILIRPSMLLFVPFAGVWLLRRFHGERQTARAVLFVALALCCVLPWTLHNRLTSGRWVLVASEGGVTFWTGNHPLAAGEGDLAANPALKAAEISFRRAHADLTPEQLEPLYYHAALAWIRANPVAWIRLEARKLFFTIVPIGPSYTLHSAKYRAASAGAYVLLLPFAAAGFRRLRGAAIAQVPLWLMAASVVVTGLIFFPQERFRIPVIDPALIVSAAAVAGLRTHERIGRRPYV